RIQSATAATGAVFGDFVADATWDAADNADLDLAIVDPAGNRVAWAGKRGVRAADCTSRFHEALAFSHFATGTYTVEIVRADGGPAPVREKIRVTGIGDQRVINFVVTGQRVQVARIDVRMDSQLVPASPQEIGARQF